MTDFSSVASVIDLGGTLDGFNVSRNTTEADFIALRSDWSAVANDIRSAMDQIESSR